MQRQLSNSSEHEIPLLSRAGSSSGIPYVPDDDETRWEPREPSNRVKKPRRRWWPPVLALFCLVGLLTIGVCQSCYFGPKERKFMTAAVAGLLDKNIALLAAA